MQQVRRGRFELRVSNPFHGPSGRPEPAPAGTHLVLVAGDDPVSVGIAEQVGLRAGANQRLILSWGDLDRQLFRGKAEFAVLDPVRPWKSLLAVRRSLRDRRIEELVFCLAPERSRRWAPLALRWRDLVAVNADGETCRLTWRRPLASWRFLRGEPLADIGRPSLWDLAWKALVWARAVTLLGASYAASLRKKPRVVLPQSPEPASGRAVLCLPGNEFAARLDSEVLACDANEIVVTTDPALPSAEAVQRILDRLAQPDVWLVCGRALVKQLLGEGLAPHRPHESGTFCLAAAASLFAFRRDVFLALGGLSAFEQQLPGQGWAALGLRAWLRGYKSVYAGDIDIRTLPLAPSKLGTDGELPSLLASSDKHRATFGLLRQYAGSREFRAAYRRRLRELRLPASLGRGQARWMALTFPGAAVFERAASPKALRIAVVCPRLPYPPRDAWSSRLHQLLSRLSENCEINLFGYSENPSTTQVEGLLEYCRRVVTVPLAAPQGTARRTGYGELRALRSEAMRAHLQALLSDWQAPLVAVESSMLAFVSAWLDPLAVVRVASTSDLRWPQFQDLDHLPAAQALHRPPAWRREVARWMRYERRYLSRFDHLVATSSREDALLGKWLPKQKRTLIQDGLNTEYFRADEKEPDEGRVLLVGEWSDPLHLVAFRNVAESIWPFITAALPGAELVVIAGDDYRTHWRRVHRQSLPERKGLTILGHVGDLRPFYQRAAVVLVPPPASHGSRSRLIEAMSMSCAVVAAPSCLDFGAESGRDLLLAERPADLASAVVRLLSNPALRAQLGAQARSFVQSWSDWGRTASEHLRLYEELIRDRSRTGGERKGLA
jgi:glycosyltransferase involved in cell wall biosynthesis